MTAVTIPAELAADVAARPEAYRPEVEPLDQVLMLGGRFRVGEVSHVEIGEDGLADSVRDAPTFEAARESMGLRSGWGSRGWREATAWALVGSVDGGPRPDVGQRVLVLDGDPVVVGRVGRCTDLETGSGTGAPIIDCGDEDGYAARWALLPPASDALPMSVSDGATSESPSATQSTEWGIRYTAVTSEAIHEFGAEPWVSPIGGPDAEQAVRQIAMFPEGQFSRQAMCRVAGGQWEPAP